MKYITQLIRAFASYRNRRFRERIDRVYFEHDGNGNRYIRGRLIAVYDKATGQNGELSAGSNLDKTEAATLMSDGKPLEDRR